MMNTIIINKNNKIGRLHLLSKVVCRYIRSWGIIGALGSCSRHATSFHMQGNETITHKQVAHIVAQTRAKQLAIRDGQDKMKDIILAYLESHPDISERLRTKQILASLQNYGNCTKAINAFIDNFNPNNVGFPIKRNKTFLQLNMAEEWVKGQKEAVIKQILSGQLYHRLPNTVASNALPILASSSDSNFWGNENPCVSSILLASIVSSWQAGSKDIPGAATFYPFRKVPFHFPDELVPSSYPFASKSGVSLYGDYQYGGHRDFTDQLLFGPEDCSSSVGKATYLTTTQVKGLNTNNMIGTYTNPNNPYHYQAVTLLEGDVKDTELNKIQSGDIYLVKGHTAMIVTKPDNKSHITTVQFSRDIDVAQQKRLGGGCYDYNLVEEAKKTSVYILRPTSVAPLQESSTLEQFLQKVDQRYTVLFPSGPTDTVGDCRVFFE